MNKLRDQSKMGNYMGLQEWWYGAQIKSEDKLRELGIGSADRMGEGEDAYAIGIYTGKKTGETFKTFGGNYTKTHKKRKTLKKRPSRKRR